MSQGHKLPKMGTRLHVNLIEGGQSRVERIDDFGTGDSRGAHALLVVSIVSLRDLVGVTELDPVAELKIIVILNFIRMRGKFT